MVICCMAVEKLSNHWLNAPTNPMPQIGQDGHHFALLLHRLQDHPHSGVRCGPHRTVRTAPALIGQKSPHHHDFRTFFEHYFRQVYLVVQYIFLQSKKKNLSPIFPFLRRSILLLKHGLKNVFFWLWRKLYCTTKY